MDPARHHACRFGALLLAGILAAGCTGKVQPAPDQPGRAGTDSGLHRHGDSIHAHPHSHSHTHDHADAPGLDWLDVDLDFATQDGRVVVATGPRGNSVSIRVAGNSRTIESNGLPDHTTGQFPSRGNPHTIRAQSYRFRMTTRPQATGRITALGMTPFGVAINGVLFDPGTAEFWNRDRNSGWRVEALSGQVNLGIDQHHAHVQPTGAYHYHGIPDGLLDRVSDDEDPEMALLGWAADGFPIYGPMCHADAADADSPLRMMRPSYKLRTGNRPGGREGPGGQYDGTYVQDWEYEAGLGDLDETNGRTGVTPQYPDGTYYYVLTENFPFIPRGWRGTPDESFHRRGGAAGPGGPGGQGGPPGMGPDGQGRRGPGGAGGRSGQGRRPDGQGPPPPPPGMGPPPHWPPPHHRRHGDQQAVPPEDSPGHPQTASDEDNPDADTGDTDDES